MTDTYTAPPRALSPGTAERLGQVFTGTAQWAVWDSWKRAAYHFYCPEMLIGGDADPDRVRREVALAERELKARSGPVCELLEAITGERVRWTDDTPGGGGLEVVAEHTGQGWRIWDWYDGDSWAVELADLCYQIEEQRKHIDAWRQPAHTDANWDEEPF